MTDEYVHPGYILRTLQNDTGETQKFPTAGVVLQPGEAAPILHAADQAVPMGFSKVGEDVPCDEHGVPLEAPPADPPAAPDSSASDKRGSAKKGAADTADASPDVTTDQAPGAGE